MNKFHKSFIPFFFLCILFSFKIQKIHSQKHVEVFSEKYRISIDSANVYSEYLIKSEEVNLQAFGHITKGYILSKTGNHEASKNFFVQGFKKIDQIQNKNQKALGKMHCLYFYSLHLLITHDLELASQKIDEGIALSKKLDNAEMRIKFKSLIGRSYSILGLGKKAMVNGVETIKALKALKPKLSESFYNYELLRNYLNTGYRALAVVYYDPKNSQSYIDSSAYYLKTAKEFLKVTDYVPSPLQERQMLSLASDILYNRKEYSRAVEYHHKVLEINKALKLGKRVTQGTFRLAECYFHMGKYSKAKEWFDKLSEKDLNKYKLLKNSVLINYYYARIYSEQGNVQEALRYTDVYNAKVDQFYENISTTKINVFTQNELNEKKQILIELAQKKKTNNQLTVTLLSILLIFSLFVIYFKYQQKKLKLKLNILSKNIDKGNKPKETSQVNEVKAKKILLKLEELEKQELFLSKDYSLNMVAKKINSNSSYVSQIVNTYWKKSFVQYTNELRINYILLKLKKDKMYQKFTLIAIAESIGYKSLGSFNKHFKIVAGVTPRQYLKFLKNSSTESN